MKIGIVTYWNSGNNYGEQLQNYALQEYLRGQGHEPFLIRYDYMNDTIYGSRPLPVRLLRACNPRRLARFFRSRKDNRDRAADAALHPRGFEGFREKNLSMSRVYGSIDELRADPPEADMYITGSDQVWNTYGGSLSEMRHRLMAFMLDFGGEDVLRVSYAASFGRTSVPDDEKELVSPLLARFDAVSVREKTAIPICGSLGREDAVLALDPVLLHGADVYRRLYAESGFTKPQSKYLFFYDLYDGTGYDRQAVFDYAASKGLEVVYVTTGWHDAFERSFPSVPGWLALIDNAEAVVTNSYHCSIISVLFEKRFGVIRRLGGYEGMNTRMDSLFELLGTEPRYIRDKDFSCLELPAVRTGSGLCEGICRPEELFEAAKAKRASK